MVAVIAAVTGCCMILFVAAQGLLPKAPFKQRVYTGAASVWAVFGGAIYHPASIMRWVPHALTANHMAQGAFALGFILLGITGACMLMGRD